VMMMPRYVFTNSQPLRVTTANPANPLPLTTPSLPPPNSSLLALPSPLLILYILSPRLRPLLHSCDLPPTRLLTTRILSPFPSLFGLSLRCFCFVISSVQLQFIDLEIRYSASPPSSPSRTPSFSLFPGLFKKSIDFKLLEKTAWKEGDVVVVFVGMVLDPVTTPSPLFSLYLISSHTFSSLPLLLSPLSLSTPLFS
jgi:hypothetical protein